MQLGTRLILWLLLLSGLNVAAEPRAKDPHSYANINEVRLEKAHFDLDLHFSNRTISGDAYYWITVLDKNADSIVLDTRDLDIKGVYAVGKANQLQPLKFRLGEKDKILGQALTIVARPMPEKIKISFATSPDSTGLLWLAPEQTTSKKWPFVFSQSQAIHARSWLPIQDSPAIRLTYTAEVRSDKPVNILMGAKKLSADKGTHRFAMQQPIPSYLMAIAAGEIVEKRIGPRTRVYAEPAVVDRAAAEFAETEKMIQTAEGLYGPYLWEDYDLLILPPSFPMGGMENPRLSFITPTVIAGDKSLVSLIAHELAHSWSGNLVTNSDWNQLWLNEGFTTYVENRIMEAIYGEERAAMERSIAYQELLEELEVLPESDKTLVGNFAGRDPDDAFTDVPYSKGMLMLKYFERKLGREAFDKLLKHYFSTNQFKSVHTQDFEKIMLQAFKGRADEKALQQALEQWLYQSEFVADFEPPKSNAFAIVDKARAEWIAGKLNTRDLPFAKWNVQQKIHFIRGIDKSIARKQLAKLDKAFSLTGTGNAEVALVWYKLALTRGYQAAYPAIEKYVSSIGRQRLILPLYELMAKRAELFNWAKNLFEKNKSFYHPTVRSRIEAAIKTS